MSYLENHGNEVPCMLSTRQQGWGYCIILVIPLGQVLAYLSLFPCSSSQNSFCRIPTCVY